LFGRYHNIPLILSVKKIKEQKKVYQNKKLVTSWVYYPVVFFRFPLPLEDMLAKYKVETDVVKVEKQEHFVTPTVEVVADDEEIIVAEEEKPVDSIEVEENVEVKETLEPKEEPTPIEPPKEKKKRKRRTKAQPTLEEAKVEETKEEKSEDDLSAQKEQLKAIIEQAKEKGMVPAAASYLLQQINKATDQKGLDMTKTIMRSTFAAQKIDLEVI